MSSEWANFGVGLMGLSVWTAMQEMLEILSTGDKSIGADRVDEAAGPDTAPPQEQPRSGAEGAPSQEPARSAPTSQQHSQPSPDSASQQAPSHSGPGAVPDQPPTEPRDPNQPPGAPLTEPPPAHRANPDGSVQYSLPPDGRTLNVPPEVAQALDAALHTVPGTDAQAAYAHTDAAWSDGMPGPEVAHRSSIATGDVAVWADRTALLVVSPAPGGSTREIIVDRRLCPFTTNARDSQGEFGAYVGVFRPHGIDRPTTDLVGPTTPWATVS